ncbi:hypothetical protein BSKO_13586 [Bryopsis sp. KO-2023]|nr:hypothetical protein BSKO_13586 [Bryopsis sp. KO-2023]
MMGVPPSGKRGHCFLKTLTVLLGLALAGMVLHLSDPFKTHTVTFIDGGGVRNMRVLSFKGKGSDSVAEPEGVDSAVRGHALLSDKGSASMSKEEGEGVNVGKNPSALMGLVTTHHKTGTQLFSIVLADICSRVGVDFQMVGGMVPLGNLAFDRVVGYSAAANSDGRIAMSMHGFKETCAAEEECDRFDAECRISTCKLLDNGDQSYGIVHVVRNPLEMLISAYLYHREMGSALIEQGFELWLLKDKSHLLPEDMRARFKGVPYHEILQELSVREGLRAEYLVNGGQIFRAARNYRDLKNRSGAMNIRFEDVQNDYEATMKRVFEKINLSEQNVPIENLLEVAGKYDTQSMPQKMKWKRAGMHMTEGKFDKAALRKAISEDQELRNAVNSLAKEMGYKTPFVQKLTTTT